MILDQARADAFATDAAVADRLASLAASGESHLVLISSEQPKRTRAKRQLVSPYVVPSDDLPPLVSSFDDALAITAASTAKNDSSGGSSTRGGILDRYTFVNPVLIVCTLIGVGLLLPIALLGVNVLLSVQLPKGLEQGKSYGGSASQMQDKKEQ